MHAWHMGGRICVPFSSINSNNIHCAGADSALLQAKRGIAAAAVVTGSTAPCATTFQQHFNTTALAGRSGAAGAGQGLWAAGGRSPSPPPRPRGCRSPLLLLLRLSRRCPWGQLQVQKQEGWRLEGSAEVAPMQPKWPT